jgi:DNA polymerase-1
MSIREWLIEEHGARLKPKLEGDDVMGILSTWRKMKGEKIIVSIDKDMKTIPGLYCRDLTLGVVEITEQEADYWHLYQTLIGDTTDGYKGCPGVGPKKAVDLIGTAEEPLYSSVQEAWETIVVPAYEKAKLTEADALQQARVARILRASDYDFKNQQPILWNPRGTGRLPTKETNADRNV